MRAWTLCLLCPAVPVTLGTWSPACCTTLYPHSQHSGQCLWELRAQPQRQLRALRPYVSQEARFPLWVCKSLSPASIDPACLSSTPRDAICGQLQCQVGRTQPLLGSARDLLWESLEANGTQLNCSWVHLDLGNDVVQPLLALPGTACGPGLVSSPGRQKQVGRDT
jgi:hypothetical protein